MNARRKLSTCQTILTVGLLLSVGSQLPALGAHGKSHHRSGRQEMPAQSASEESQEQASEEQTSQESSAPAEEAQSSGDGGSRSKEPVSREGVSLFNILGQVLGVGLLIVVFGALPMSAMVLFCSMIWHSQKALNGGKKPSIG
jgi:hypothetical protein